MVLWTHVAHAHVQLLSAWTRYSHTKKGKRTEAKGSKRKMQWHFINLINSSNEWIPYNHINCNKAECEIFDWQFIEIKKRHCGLSHHIWRIWIKKRVWFWLYASYELYDVDALVTLQWARVHAAIQLWVHKITMAVIKTVRSSSNEINNNYFCVVDSHGTDVLSCTLSVALKTDFSLSAFRNTSRVCFAKILCAVLTSNECEINKRENYPL